MDLKITCCGHFKSIPKPQHRAHQHQKKQDQLTFGCHGFQKAITDLIVPKAGPVLRENETFQNISDRLLQ